MRVEGHGACHGIGDAVGVERRAHFWSAFCTSDSPMKNLSANATPSWNACAWVAPVGGLGAAVVMGARVADFAGTSTLRERPSSRCDHQSAHAKSRRKRLPGSTKASGS